MGWGAKLPHTCNAVKMLSLSFKPTSTATLGSSEYNEAFNSEQLPSCTVALKPHKKQLPTTQNKTYVSKDMEKETGRLYSCDYLKCDRTISASGDLLSRYPVKRWYIAIKTKQFTSTNAGRLQNLLRKILMWKRF